eukprot:gene1349-24304_t
MATVVSVWVTPAGGDSEEDAVELRLRQDDSVSTLLREALGQLRRFFPQAG